MNVGKYKTAQKQAIYNYLLENSEKYFTIDETLLYLQERGISVGRTTIYRFFKFLLEEGVIQAYRSNKNELTCYKLIDTKHEEQVHFKCDSCDKLIHLDCANYSQFVEHVNTKHNMIVNNIKTVLYGTCSECLRDFV